MNRVADFELELMDMQPHCDMVFGCENINEIWNQSKRTYDDHSYRSSVCNRDDIIHMEDDEKNIAKIREIALRNNYVKKIGYQFNENDSDSEYTRELEITNMIRNCGLESDLYENINSKKTLKPIHSNKKYEFNGYDKNFIVLLDESYFKLKPKKKDKSEKIKGIDDDNNSLKSSSVSVKSNSSKSSRNEKISTRIREAGINAITPVSAVSKKQSVKNNHSLLDYYDQFKFYTPKEIYNKRNKNNNKLSSSNNKSTRNKATKAESNLLSSESSTSSNVSVTS